MAYQHLPKKRDSYPASLCPGAQLEHNQILYRFEANVFHNPSTIFAMVTLPPLNTFKLEDAEKPRIGFRVIASGGEEWLRNSLGSRDPQADATSQTLLAHLAWKPAPFVSLWKSWPRAVSWAKSRQRLGAENIDIVAVWIYDLVVYDAYKAAATLPLPPNKRLSFYNDEVVTRGLGGEDENKILACFFRVTERLWETVSFVLDGRPFSTSLPIGLLEVEVSSDEEEAEREDARRWQKGGFAALREEVFFRTKSRDNSKVRDLVELLCEEPSATAPAIPPRPTSQDVASPELSSKLAKLSIE